MPGVLSLRNDAFAVAFVVDKERRGIATWRGVRRVAGGFSPHECEGSKS